ncbi:MULTISPECIES: hypothetical protein [Pseudoalteromonas]|uniref:Uncharacterized protein n=1 Tax=Pseudoalteromonas aliena SW19 TaxID=1314866 RepID=A0ABR9E057_9GAMM|nr:MULTISPECIES: hypothetical protein [Pseudoalteromonas]MBE0360002.1 hypothetical protein [Pseudoalteromonas aliena SW19]TMN94216.1 hypothetical protein CWB66_20340 [Pseudoalteromonas sp. S558]
MHSRYAAVFGIENLELNKHFKPADTFLADSFSTDNLLTDSHAPDTVSQNNVLEPIELSSQLLADIKRAAVPIAINSVVQSAEVQLKGDQLVLTTPQLSTADKRALWALMSEHLDKL